MRDAGRATHILRFGSFEIDLRTEELRRHGRKVKLPAQSFQILAMLLARPGELITREEIQEKLWPDGTAVAFETSINAAVRRLRQALGDTAAEPRFVETLARRGYRFIAAVDESYSASDVVVLPSGPARIPITGGQDNTVRAPQPQLVPPAPEIRQFPAPSPLRIRRVWVAGGLLALASVSAAIWRMLSSPGAPAVIRTFRVTQTGRVEASMPIATDGSRLYFVERLGGHFQLAAVRAAGGNPEPLITPFRDSTLFGISPNGASLLIGDLDSKTDDPSLWLLPTGGGSPRRVGDVTAHAASFSSDGRLLAYANGSGLYVANSEGSGARRILTPSAAPKEISWNADGRSLRFTLPWPEPSSVSIWEVSLDGTGFRRALPDWRGPRTRWADGESSGSWVGQGKYFVFRSARDGVPGVWTIREDGGLWCRPGSPSLLYEGPMNFDTVMAPDEGTRMYFTGDQDRRELMRYDSGLGKFVPYMQGVSAQWVSYSRDGQWVAYVSLPERELWRSRIDGTHRQQLTFVPTQAAEPQWSPDGTQIAFSMAQGGRQNIALVPSSGGTPRRLAAMASRFPSWAPDGKSVLFHRMPGGADAQTICSVDVATGVTVEISGARGLSDPVVSPDGRRAAAQSSDDRTLMLFDFQTRQWTGLVTVHTLYGVYWSRDGRWLYYQDVFGGVEQPIYRINVQSRRVERVTARDAFLRGDVRSYTFKALAPDDAPIIGLARATSDIYALEVKLP